MDKKSFEELISSIQEMDRVVAGKGNASRTFDFPDPEVKAVRLRLGISQEKFAVLLGVSKRTLENWEQGRRHPAGPARSLLRIVEANPEQALKVLSA